MDLGNSLFKQEDFFKIKNAVKDLEEHTAGEIVPVIAESSARYNANILFFAAVLSYFTSFFVIYFFKLANIFFPIIGLFSLLVLIMFFKLRSVKRFIISNKDKEKAVFELSSKMFFDKNLHKTVDKTGIMIFISLFERKVLVLGDEGINSKISQEDWDAIVNIIRTNIKKSKVIDGLVEAIYSCETLLKKHFPIKANDKNELPNELVIVEEKDLGTY